VGGVLLASYVFSYASQAATTVSWESDHRTIDVTAGASGTSETDGWIMASGTNEIVQATYSTAHATIDTTTAKTLLWTVQMSVATYSVTQRAIVVDRG
jgi:hypothetical protein